MEIIKGEKGWYIQIDIPNIGFAESEWYPSEAELARAVLHNEVKWYYITDF